MKWGTPAPLLRVGYSALWYKFIVNAVEVGGVDCVEGEEIYNCESKADHHSYSSVTRKYPHAIHLV